MSQKHLAQARQILEGNPELAARYGYVPQDQRPEVIVSAKTPQARLDELVAAGYRPVIDQQLSRSLGELPTTPQITTDPETGRQVYSGSFQPQAAFTITGGSAGTPPVTVEQAPDWTLIRGGVDRYAANPLVDYYRQAMPGAEFVGPGPTMFLHGDLPVITGSGLPVEVLRWVPFWARHDAALTESRARVFSLIEDADTPAIGMLSHAGRKGWEDYAGRVSTWVNTMPPLPELTAEDYAQLYDDGGGVE
jgi:hypothetical protein